MALDNIHIRLLSFHFTYIEAHWWKYFGVQSNFWRLYMNISDGAVVEHEEHVYPLEAGKLYFIPSNVRFNSRVSHSVGHFHVHFDVLGLPQFVKRELFGQPICLPELPVLEQKVQEIASELRDKRGVVLLQQLQVKAILYEGLIQYLAQYPYEQLQRYSQLVNELEPVLPAIQYIEENLSEPLRISELAQLCYMHTDYFTRRFRACVGLAPAHYVQAQRIKKAEQQLLLTEDSIERIAADNGFGSRYYFSRIFTKHVGVSPAAYRKGFMGK